MVKMVCKDIIVFFTNPTIVFLAIVFSLVIYFTPKLSEHVEQAREEQRQKCVASGGVYARSARENADFDFCIK